MSELERKALNQMLSQFSGMQAVAIDAEEPDGAHYEYDRNLRTTVRVTPDGERTPVQELERTLRSRELKSFAQNCAGGNHNLSHQKPAPYIVAEPLGAGKTTFYKANLKEAFPTLVR